MANCIELRQKAYRFQHDTYAQLGIVNSNKGGLWLTLHDALPQTTTFIAEDSEGKLAGTLTQVYDTNIDLPADSLFPDEMKSIRKNGARVCELISFGTSRNMRGSVKILAGLLYCSYLFALHARKVTDYVITVHERLEKFYCGNLLFSRLGPVRKYGKVNGEPTVLLTLNLDLPDALRESQRIFPLSLFNNTREQEREIATIIDRLTAPMSSQEFAALFSDEILVWKNATSAQKEIIQKFYPSDHPAL